jgi:hypothetical protein
LLAIKQLGKFVETTHNLKHWQDGYCPLQNCNFDRFEVDLMVKIPLIDLHGHLLFFTQCENLPKKI